MKKFKKVIAVALAAAMVTTMFAGCDKRKLMIQPRRRR